jgi:hypothetical protein
MPISARLILLAAIASFSGALLAQKSVASDKCVRTSGMQVYSNVFSHKETGDLLGYELAIKRSGDSGVDALLYIYEGGDSNDGIPLSGHILNSRLTVQGTWADRLIEHPSKREIVEKHFVKIVGALGSEAFKGELTIEGMEEPERVRLKHVKRIWSCTKLTPSTQIE